MEKSYYSLPIRFKDVIEKKDLIKTNINVSIQQNISLIITSALGECKFDQLFGCKIWDDDFDLLIKLNILKDKIQSSIKEALLINEPRLDLQEIIINVDEIRSKSMSKYDLRIKKRVNVNITGFIKLTNESFELKGGFFIGPFSLN